MTSMKVIYQENHFYIKLLNTEEETTISRLKVSNVDN